MARVLIVGDETTATVTRDTLSQAAPTYYTSPYTLSFDAVATSTQACELMRTRNYELLVVDVLTARADNAEFLRTVRLAKPRADLPIVVMSAVSGIAVSYELIRHGANDCFAIPLHGEELERFVRVAFNLILER